MLGMFEKERQAILRDYSLSPRCVKTIRQRPYQQFYSWKNYLNANIDHLYNKLKRREYSHCVPYEAKNQGKEGQERKYSTENLQEPGDDEMKKNGKKKYSKFQLQIPHDKREGVYGTQCSSHSQGTSPFLTKRDDMTTVLTGEIENLNQADIKNFSDVQQYQSAIKNTQNYRPSQKKPYKYLDSSVKRVRKEKQMRDGYTEMNKIQTQEIGIGTSNEDHQHKIDWYHLGLKEAQRVYLLNRYMHHYEGIHKYKL